MAYNYRIGNSQNQISLKIDVQTVGLAATAVVVSDPNSANDNGEAVAESADATGDIATRSIGNYTRLKGKSLGALTKIALTGTSAADRQAQANAVNAKFTLNGGDDGEQTFGSPTVTYLDPNVFLNFVVDLT